jgi:dolichol-phosphate mannosyltransferase
MKVSILILTKNEPYVGQLVKEIHKTIRMNHEVIVIDKSKKLPKVKDALVLRQQSDGLGNAVLEGLKHATGDVIVTMDSDGSHSPTHMPKLLEKIKDYDIVIGSRFVKGGKTLDKPHRRILSLVFRKFASFVLDLKIEDPMSGFAAVKREVYDKIKLRPLGYKINTEILYKSKGRFKAVEVPIVFLERKSGKSKAGVKEALRTMRFVLELGLGLR